MKGELKALNLLMSTIVMLALVIGCQVMLQPTPAKASLGKIVMVIAPKNFQELELERCREVFEQKGFEVVIASATTAPATGIGRKTTQPDMSISQIEVKDYLALVIIGGIGSKTYLWDNADLHQVVKRADEERIVVAAICLSPVVLAKAGVLEGKEATVYPDPEAIAELEKGGATFRNKSVVASDNIITGRGPKASKSFATTIVKTLAENPSLFPLSANALSVMLRN